MRYVLPLVFITLFGCKKAATDDAVAPAETSSFALMQERILTPSCATSGCHQSAQDASFKQHGLVLAAGVAYKNLVNVAAQQPDAKAEGLLRVKPFASLQSLLFHKLNFDGAHHSGKTYGNPMPLGGQPLPVGQLEFVRRWIEAGAPETGSVADATLLDDKTPSYTATFAPLDAPAAGTGFQLKIDPFDVAPNFERELFVRRTVGNTQDIYVSRFQVKMRPGSHHFLAYDFNNKALAPPMNFVRDLRNADNSMNLLTALSMSNHVYLAGSQSPNADFSFPAGTALLIPGGASLDLNAHYANKTSATVKGEAYLNFYTTDKAQVKNVVRTINWANNNLSLPAGQRTTVRKSFTFGKAAMVLTLTSHMHKLGEKFVIRINGGPRNGEIIYSTTDWEHPDIINLSTPLRLDAGQGLTSEITYNNTTSRTVSFGLTSDDEMGIIFGYYYEL